jgi:hypothetical protein
MNISIKQALGIYDELVNAYYNKNGYGGNIAEIYVYRFLPYSSTYEKTWNNDTGIFKDNNIELETDAFKSFYEIIKEFLQHHNSSITINGMNLEESYKVFVTDKTQRFSHRVHVEVNPK